MSCFGGRVSQDLYQNCCNSNVLCEFDGDLSNVVSEPIYVQKVLRCGISASAGHENSSKSVVYSINSMWTQSKKSNRYQNAGGALILTM